jgi:porphobilinogen deaminase
MPIGGIATPAGTRDLELQAVVVSLDGTRAIRYRKTGVRAMPADLGRQVAEHLLATGADEILREARLT